MHGEADRQYLYLYHMARHIMCLLCQHLEGHLIESVLDGGAVHPLVGGTIELADDGCFGSLVSLVVVFDMTTVPADRTDCHETHCQCKLHQPKQSGML